MKELTTILISRYYMPLTVPVCFFLVVGMVMVMSSSSEYSIVYYGSALYMASKQSILALLGCCGLLLVVRYPLNYWRRSSWLLLLLNLLLLILVFVPSVGHEMNASRRWLNLGLYTFQPSELLKLSIPLFLAAYFSSAAAKPLAAMSLPQTLNALLLPSCCLLIISGLLLLQPDFASVVIYSITFVIMLLFIGLKLGYFLLLLLSGVAASLTLIALQPYRLARFSCLSDTAIWEQFYQQCYQIGQALVAIERGGLWGLGIGNSIQKSFYLPEAYTDFVFAILTEELGLLFGSLVIFLFIYLIISLLQFGSAAYAKERLFHAYFIWAIALIWGLQFLFNLGVTVAYLPVTGLTLPFISYGGSSLLVNLVLFGFLLRAIYESKPQLPQPIAPASTRT